jgi:hypothetical protein
MIEPPKLSPFSGPNDAYGLAPLGKARGEYATGCQAANPVPSLFGPGMLAVCQLKSLRIEKRFDCFCETHTVFPDIFDVFCKVPFEFHRLDHTISANRLPST